MEYLHGIQSETVGFRVEETNSPKFDGADGNYKYPRILTRQLNIMNNRKEAELGGKDLAGMGAR